MMRWKTISRPCMQKYFMQHKVYYCAKISNKQSAKVICRFDSKMLTSAHTFNYIVLRVNHGLTNCKDLATALVTIKSIPLHLCDYTRFRTSL